MIIADAITKPAIKRAAWRLRRRIFSLARRHTTNRSGTSNGWAKTWLIIPMHRAPTQRVTPVIPNHINTQYAINESTTGAATRSVTTPFDSCLLRPICKVEMLAGIPTSNSRTTVSISRFTPPHYPACR